MPQIQLYNHLIQFPLFIGMSRSDLDEVVAKTKFDFFKVHPHKVFLKTDTPCEHLYLLTHGTLRGTRTADNHHYTVDETLSAPLMLETHRLFGLHQRFAHTYTAVTPCNFIRISKAEVVRLSTRFEIVRINLVNLLATIGQRYSALPWKAPQTEIEKKIATFIHLHCSKPAGEKVIHIKMEVLAAEIAESRLNVSKALHAMENRQLLTLQRGCIHIPALERLLQ